MARKKKIGTPRHLHIDPYVWAGEDARRDKLVAWYDQLPAQKRTRMVVDLLVAAIHGELGVAVVADMGDENSAQNKSALDDLLKNMVMDEE
jgi:hypothetical protein